jgi:hypothetical protein
MNEKIHEAYHPEMDPWRTREWMRPGPNAGASLLVIAGCTAIGYGAGTLANHSLPYGAIGFGAGLLIWGWIVSLSR